MRDMGNYGSKMSEPSVIPQEGENRSDIFKDMVEYNVVGLQENIYSILPKVFIDGYTLTKVALTNQFVDCAHYQSRSGITFEGCLLYDRHNTENKLIDVRGIYYTVNSPIYYFYSGRKLSRSESEMKNIVLSQVESLAGHIKTNTRLLIKYNNYGAEVYNKYVKGKIIKFPKSAEQGHLFISWVPRVPTGLQFEKVTELNLYNHTIQFKSDVIKFNITALGGGAQLIYNNHSVNVIGISRSPDHGEKEIELMHGSFYLFSHPRPLQRRGID